MNPDCVFEPTSTGSMVTDMIQPNSELLVYMAIANNRQIHAIPIQDHIVIDGKLYIGTALTIKAMKDNEQCLKN